MARNQDYSALIEELNEICVQKRTGTFFITDGDKHIAVFIIDEGRIAGCRYRGKSGHDALALVKGINTGTTRFVEGMFSSMGDVPLPATDNVLQTLSGAADGPPRTSGETPPSELGDSESSAIVAAMEEIRSDLARVVGPIGVMDYEDYIEQHGNVRTRVQAMDMVHALAMDIGDPAKKKQFIDRASDKLAH